MWPFTRTLSERYSKLVKLIKSIDSHFQITEDVEDSLRLHLPNYKGNQPMDFHIYLMEPQLHISFVTEIEGEKISVLSFFDQNTDQQDMFNAAMARNLNKIHEVLGKKYSVKKDAQEKATDSKSKITPTLNKNLTEEQRYALYFIAETLGGGLYIKKYKDETSKKETIKILHDYQEDLELNDAEVKYIISPDFKMRLSEVFMNLKGIKDKFVIDSFLYTCVSLVDLNTSESTEKDFFRMMMELGYNREDAKMKIKSISFKYDKHFFDKGFLEEKPIIVQTWSLLDFAKIYGPKMQVGEFSNKETGEIFKSCIFTKPDGNRTFVAFSAKMGELTPTEIAAMKEELVVVQYEDGNFSLCKKDPNNLEDVDLCL